MFTEATAIMEANKALWEGYRITITPSVQVWCQCEEVPNVAKTFVLRKNVYKKRIASARKKVEQFFGQPEMEHYFLVDVDFSDGNALVDYIFPKGHENRSSFRNMLQHKSRCGHDSCAKEKTYKKRIATATKNVEEFVPKTRNENLFFGSCPFFQRKCLCGIFLSGRTLQQVNIYEYVASQR